MSVAIVCGGNIVAGKEIMGLELGEALSKAGLSVFYITSKWGDGEFKRRLDIIGLPNNEIRLGFISATLTLECMGMTADQLVRLPKMLLDYRRILDRNAPSRVIHTNWHHLLLLWPFLRPQRDIFWLHEVVPNKPQYARLFTALAKRIDCYCAVSEAVAVSLRQIGVSDSKIRVIHNGIQDPNIGFEPCSKSSSGSDIGIVGQVGEWKGHDDLLTAFWLIAMQHPDARLHIFGDNNREFARNLAKRAGVLGIAERVYWHGYVNDRFKIFPMLDICVVPSRVDDPLPTSAIEASFFGKPIIATRRGGLPEIVVDGETGFLVDTQSPDQIADRLSQLLASSDLRTQFGARAQERAGRHFSRERFINDFLQLIHSQEAQSK